MGRIADLGWVHPADMSRRLYREVKRAREQSIVATLQVALTERSEAQFRAHRERNIRSAYEHVDAKGECNVHAMREALSDTYYEFVLAPLRAARFFAFVVIAVIAIELFYIVFNRSAYAAYIYFMLPFVAQFVLCHAAFALGDAYAAATKSAFRSAALLNFVVQVFAIAAVALAIAECPGSGPYVFYASSGSCPPSNGFFVMLLVLGIVTLAVAVLSLLVANAMMRLDGVMATFLPEYHHYLQAASTDSLAQ